jgi:hypothetical protein
MERGDLVVPPFWKSGVASRPECRGGSAIVFFGESDHKALRSNFNGGNAVIKCAEPWERAVSVNADRLTAKILVFEYFALSPGGWRNSESGAGQYHGGSERADNPPGAIRTYIEAGSNHMLWLCVHSVPVLIFKLR